MDASAAALLAAGIAALVASATFVVGEVMKIRGIRDGRVFDAVRETRAALVAIPDGDAMNSKRNVSVAGTAMLDLLAVVPPADRVFVLWARDLLADADADFGDQVESASQVHFELNLWLADRGARRRNAARAVGRRRLKIPSDDTK